LGWSRIFSLRPYSLSSLFTRLTTLRASFLSLTLILLSRTEESGLRSDGKTGTLIISAFENTLIHSSSLGFHNGSEFVSGQVQGDGDRELGSNEVPPLDDDEMRDSGGNTPIPALLEYS